MAATERTEIQPAILHISQDIGRNQLCACTAPYLKTLIDRPCGLAVCLKRLICRWCSGRAWNLRCFTRRPVCFGWRSTTARCTPSTARLFTGKDRPRNTLQSTSSCNTRWKIEKSTGSVGIFKGNLASNVKDIERRSTKHGPSSRVCRIA